MNESERQFVIVLGTLTASSLYIAGCFVAGVMSHNSLAWRCALASAGAAYLSYIAQMAGKPVERSAMLAFLASIALGAAAGVSLLFGGL